MLPDPDARAVWVSHAQRCLLLGRVTPSFVETHMIGLGSFRDAEATGLYKRLEIQLDDAQRRQKSKRKA